MRVTQNFQQAQFISSLDSLESNIATTNQEISTGLSYTTPAQNPTAAGQVDGYNQVLAQSQQYTNNANAAQTGLNIEDAALTQATSQLQSLRSLALEASSGTASSQNLSALATQAQQIQQTLLGIANTQDGSGNYIFAGYASQTQPFSLTATGASYAGDQGQPQVQIAAGQTLATADNGNTVFNQIKTGNGTFTVSAGSSNAGSAVIGATAVTSAATYADGNFTITFTGASSYQVTTPPPPPPATATVVSSGTYTSGEAIAFAGIQVTLTGTPSTGDSFTVAPSTNQSVFATVQNLVTTLQSTGATGVPQTQLSNSIAGSINNIDQALSNLSNVQTSVGGRLNALTTQLSVNTSQQAQLQQSITTLSSLDYASAITSLDSQNTTLSAAMQAYTLTEGLSLFKYITG